uniref:Uncharacterized protein n=1 Tax=viral metagenome TaxID=1070528 RepID=A0A6M3LQ52_9ZZZZ
MALEHVERYRRLYSRDEYTLQKGDDFRVQRKIGSADYENMLDYEAVEDATVVECTVDIIAPHTGTV